jgi:hypothetical protein
VHTAVIACRANSIGAEEHACVAQVVCNARYSDLRIADGVRPLLVGCCGLARPVRDRENRSQNQPEHQNDYEQFEQHPARLGRVLNCLGAT